MSILIHGKPYITVAERVQEAHKACKTLRIETELVSTDPAIVKASVLTEKGIFTGYSAANPSKLIEKMSPIEVAETSAVGRALGFAGFGIVDGIATADEIAKAQPEEEGIKEVKTLGIVKCSKCQKNLTQGETTFFHEVTEPKKLPALCYMCSKKQIEEKKKALAQA